MKFLAKEFNETLDEHYGIYLNSTMAFSMAQKEIIRMTNNFAKGADVKKVPFYHYDQDMDANLHEQTMEQLLRSFNKNGRTYLFLGKMFLITIYQFWEDVFRIRIARTLGVKKNEVISDIFGDLRLIRHSIIHHKSIALKEVEKCKKLIWFKENDEIVIDDVRVHKIVEYIREYLNSIDSI